MVIKTDQKTIAKELEQLVCQSSGFETCEIANWAYKTRLASLRVVDQSVLDTLEELGAMDMGSEFEWTETELRNLVSTLKRWTEIDKGLCSGQACSGL